MKKFDIKKLFVVLLALVMVFALVACNPDDGDDDDDDDNNVDTVTTITATDYFNTLWNNSKSIGSTAFAEKDDVKIDLGLILTVQSIQTNAAGSKNDVLESWDLGIDLSLVYDRDGGDNSAAKVSLYNASKGRTDGKLMTLYYFLKAGDTRDTQMDTSIFVEMGGQQFKYRFDNGFNTDSNTLFYKGVNDFLAENGIDSLVTSLLSQGGANWSLNSPINTVIGMIPGAGDFIADLKNPEAGSTSEMIVGLLNTALGVSPENLFDEDDNFNLQAILAAPKLNSLFKSQANPNNIVKKEVSGSLTNYKMEVPLDNILGILQMVPDIQDAIEPIIGTSSKYAKINLEYDVVSNNGVSELDNFSIYAGFYHKASRSNGWTFPAVKIVIDELEIENLGEISPAEGGNTSYTDVAKDVFGIDLEDFSDSFYFDVTAEMVPEGLSVMGYSFDQKVTANIKANLDMFNETANKTKAYAQIKIGNSTLLEASFFPQEDGTYTLTVKADSALKDKNNKVYMEMVARLAGDALIDFFAANNMQEFANLTKDALFSNYETKTYNTDFVGLYVEDIEFNLVDLIKSGYNQYLKDNQKEEGGAQTAEADTKEYFLVGENKYAVVGDEIYGISLDIGSVITYLPDFILTEDGGNGLALKVENLISQAAKLLTVNATQTYTLNKGAMAADSNATQLVEKYFTGENDSLLARIFAYNNPAAVAICQELGLIGKTVDLYNAQGTFIRSATKDVSMMSKEEINTVYTYMTTEVSFADYSAEAGEDAVVEVVFDEAMANGSMTYLKTFYGWLAGSAVGTDVDTAKEFISVLANSDIEIALNLKDGFSVRASVEYSDALSISFDIKFGLVAGDLSADLEIEKGTGEGWYTFTTVS